MIFPLLVTRNTSKVTNKRIAARLLATMGPIHIMLLVGFATLTRSTPRVDIESFTTWKPMLTDLFRPSGNELKCLACTLIAVVLNSTILEEGFFVVFHQVTAETLAF